MVQGPGQHFRAGRRGLSRRAFLKAGGAAAAMAASGVSSRAFASSRLVVYSTTMTPVQRKLEKAFTAKTGIEVQSLRLINNPLAQRFMAEQRAGQYLCDVVTLGLEAFFQDAAKQGLLASLSDIPNASRLSPMWRTSTNYVNIAFAPNTIGYNTNLVKGAQVPKEWADILRPEFAGQIVLPDPRANDTGVAFLNMLHDAYGDDFIRKLGKGIKLAPTLQPAVEQVVSGGGRVILPMLDMAMIQYEGTKAPIATIPAPSPTMGQNFFSGIAANAPNKEAARLWMDFTLSQEGQEILCKDICVSPLGKIPGSLAMPADVKTTDTVTAMRKANLLFDLLGLPA